MPENEFSSRKNGRDEDTAQNHEHLDEMTADELTDALSDMWDEMDETNYDPAKMDAYLAELEKQEPISPDFDVDASLAAFHEKHAWLFKQATPVQIPTAAKPVHRRRWRPSLVAAIILVMILCSMMTAQALGFDVFGAIARWTEETFHFSTSTQSADNQQSSSVMTEGEYATLQEALDSCGISEPITPSWLPDGFEADTITVTPQVGIVRIRASYRAHDRNFSVMIRQYDSPENMDSATFEKDSADIIVYEQGSITHYIMSNNASLTATWMAGEQLLCSISGDLTVDEMKQIINSIYEG